MARATNRIIYCNAKDCVSNRFGQCIRCHIVICTEDIAESQAVCKTHKNKKEVKMLTPLKISIWLLLAFVSTAKAEGGVLAKDNIDPNRLASAIYLAENSVKFPYGIKSVNTHGDKVYARKICLNSIRNAHKRWQKAGKPEDFVSFMGRRFSPPDKNPNWCRLVHYFYLKGELKK